MMFAHSPDGVPLSIVYDDLLYYYVTNLQGDVVAILDATGAEVVTYTYDAWGNILTIGGDDANTLGRMNPLRYRGYVYDQETGLYYLQSRYYDPEMGRFINADGFTSTGQGFLGNNMFVYCGNNPVNYFDPMGNCFYDAKGRWCHDNWEYIGGYERKPDPGTFEELSALTGGTITFYKGVPIVNTPLMGDSGFSYGGILLGTDIKADDEGVRIVRHEYGHTRQLQEQGLLAYTGFVVIPSVACYHLANTGKLDVYYYSLPWEFEADVYGGVFDSKAYSSHAQQAYYVYKAFTYILRGEEIPTDLACKINS